MKNLRVLVVGLLWLGACSSSPGKKDDVVKDPVQVESVRSAAD